MLKFFSPRNHQLFKCACIVQKDMTKVLFAKDEFEGVELVGLNNFCFPTEEPISGPMSFVFRYKPQFSEEFYHVFCLLDQTSFQLKEFDTNLQCCICIITQCYHFAVFEEALKIVRSLLLHNIASAQHFLEALYSNPKSITAIESIQRMIHASSNPQISLQQMITPISSIFDPPTIGAIIFALLSDTPFIIVSSDLSNMTQFCYGLQALISPLIWHMLYVPVLPSSLKDTLMSPAPFIAGVHSALIEGVNQDEIEAHILVNLNRNELHSYRLPEIPAWAAQLCGGLKSSNIQEIHQFIVRIVCAALGVHPSSSCATTARRILTAHRLARFEPGTVVHTLVNSRTLKCFFDALAEQPVPAIYTHLLESCSVPGLPSPASQDVEEFPLRSQVARSSSVQFGPNGVAQAKVLTIPKSQSVMITQ